MACVEREDIMNNLPNVDIILDKVTIFQSLIVTVLGYFLGPHWFLFIAYIVLNLFDYVTGSIRSRINKTSSSEKGAIGIMKKLMYWIMIGISFGLSAIFIHIGDIIGVNLDFTSLVGYLTLATLIINEFRSIIENLVESGCKVPTILIKGLEVANKTLENKMGSTVETEEDK